MDDEKAAWGQQLAEGLPEDLLRQARDYLRRERPDMDREAVEREAVASVRAWLSKQQPKLEPAIQLENIKLLPPVFIGGEEESGPGVIPKREARSAGAETMWLAYAAKRNGVIQ